MKKRTVITVSTSVIVIILSFLGLFHSTNMKTVAVMPRIKQSNKPAIVHEPIVVTDAIGRELPNLTNKIEINDLSESLSTEAKFYFDPEKTYEEKLSVEQVFKYLGKPIRPKAFPSDLKEWVDEAGTRVYSIIYNNDGTVAYDTFSFGYSSDFESYDPLNRKFHISVSKRGVQNDCIYIDSEAMKKSEISGIDMIIGHRKRSYGPYKNPDGYYDMYVAEFYYDGIDYEVISYNLTKDEFIEIVESLLK